MTAHRLLINEVPEIGKYLIEVRPQLKLLPNSIDIEADDLLEAKKVNREVLLRRQLKPIQSDFDVILIDTPRRCEQLPLMPLWLPTQSLSRSIHPASLC